MALVKHLVNELGLDANAMDCEGHWPNHWGTPLSYTCHSGDDGEVVRFQLDRGADPSIKDCWGIHDALAISDFKQIPQYLRCFIYGWRRKVSKGKGTLTLNDGR